MNADQIRVYSRKSAAKFHRFLTGLSPACYTVKLLISVRVIRKQPESSRSGFRRGHA